MERAKDGFVLIGAGLPRTGTLSTRAALKQLLDGDIYHMAVVMNERFDHHAHWRRALQGKASVSDWQNTMLDYRGGVDYPISFFYKELMEAFPNAKILLNVRDPVKWYESVKTSILRLQTTAESWPCSWFFLLMGRSEAILLTSDLSRAVPSCSSTGLGMFGAVTAGQEAAVQYYHDHVNEVKSVVPADRLLVWEVKEGWGPLCKFLGVPVPKEPFPRVNDSDMMEKARGTLLVTSWLLILLVPLMIAGCAWHFAWGSWVELALMAGAYCLLVGVFRLLAGNYYRNYTKSKKD